MKLHFAECDIQKACIDLLSLRGFRIMPRDAEEEGPFPAGTIWRNNSGASLIREVGRKPRLVTYGLPGSADNLGWLAHTGRFFAVEIKKPANKLLGKRAGSLSAKQRAFLASVNRDGGVGVCVWDAATLDSVLDELLTRNRWARFDVKGNVVGSPSADTSAPDDEVENPF